MPSQYSFVNSRTSARPKTHLLRQVANLLLDRVESTFSCGRFRCSNRISRRRRGSLMRAKCRRTTCGWLPYFGGSILFTVLPAFPLIPALFSPRNLFATLWSNTRRLLGRRGARHMPWSSSSSAPISAVPIRGRTRTVTPVSTPLIRTTVWWRRDGRTWPASAFIFPLVD